MRRNPYHNLIFHFFLFLVCASISLTIVHALPGSSSESVVDSGGSSDKKTEKSKGLEKIDDVIEHIVDEDLRYFIKMVHEKGVNPYPNVNFDIWLRKAIEEPSNELSIIKFLFAKGTINMSLPWFSKIDGRLSIELPMHRAAYLGKVDIVSFLLERRVTRYEDDHMFVSALEGAHPRMVKLLLEKGIFDKEKFYGLSRSIVPHALMMFCIGGIIPATIWAFEKYSSMHLPALKLKHYVVLFTIFALLILFQIFINISRNTDREMRYLHVLAALPIGDDPQGKKARNIGEIAKMLLEEGVDPNQKGSYIQELGAHEVKRVEGITPLFFAIHNGNFLLVEILIWHGADVNALAQLKSLKKDNIVRELEGNKLVVYSPFFSSLEEKVLEVWTPLDYAQKEGQMEIYNYLKQLKGTQKARHYKDLLNFLAE